MCEVHNIEDYKPHITISSIKGAQHVIPVSFFRDVVTGDKNIKDLDEFEKIIPTILHEWLRDILGDA